MSIITDQLSRSFRRARRMVADDARNAARTATDELFAHYGYGRSPSLLARILPISAAFTTGVVVGAAAGLLLAPQSGEETRSELMQRARRMSARVNTMLRNNRRNGRAERHDNEESVRGGSRYSAEERT